MTVLLPSHPPEAVELSPIETWENLNPQRNTLIQIAIPEFTSVCPKTGLPDFATITLTYVPDKLVIELKAFKYYLLGYRNMGIFYENVINKILTEVVDAIQPRFLKITGEFTPRGGISTVVQAVHVADGFDTAGLAHFDRLNSETVRTTV